MGGQIVVRLQLTNGASDGVYARLAALVCDPDVALWQMDKPGAGDGAHADTLGARSRRDAEVAQAYLGDDECPGARLAPSLEGGWVVEPAFAAVDG